MLNTQNKKGFSLAEMMVVMLMLSIIFAAAAPILTKRASQKSETSSETLPKGSVILWSGTIAKIPSGWHLCDGSNGTPDLRNKFIVCAGADTTNYSVGWGHRENYKDQLPSGNYGIGCQGGLDFVGITVVEMPIHNHSAWTDAQGNHQHSATTSWCGDHTHGVQGYAGWYNANFYAHITAGVNGNSSGETSPAGGHNHTLDTTWAGNHGHNVGIGNAGSSWAHENRPPFYALAYIMKL